MADSEDSSLPCEKRKMSCAWGLNFFKDQYHYGSNNSFIGTHNYTGILGLMRSHSASSEEGRVRNRNNLREFKSSVGPLQLVC